jgi:hypothetical protein
MFNMESNQRRRLLRHAAILTRLVRGICGGNSWIWVNITTLERGCLTVLAFEAVKD